VPLVFSGPGIPKGESRAMAYLYDIYPTVCELAGVPVPHGLDGRSLVPVLQGKSPSVRQFALTAYRDVQRAIRDERWKLIRYPKIGKTQLFDLGADPHEMNDLAAMPEHATQVKRLTAALERAQKEFGDDCPLKVAAPRDAAWSPARLTAADIEAQRKETAVCAGERQEPSHQAKPARRTQ
jgi:arylsulfatase A-like enzyme